MKDIRADIAQISPNARGWWLHYAGAVREMASLDEAAAAIPATARLHLALPCQMALVERLILPATNHDELVGMAQLQLEKTLPYPLEEAASGMEVISQAENESTILSIAVNTESLSRLCEPLRARQRVPRKITLFAQHFAAACPPGESVLAVWSEQEHIVIAIFEGKKLSWAQTLPSADPEMLAEELPGLLLGAEMDGVPTGFTRVMLARECGHFREPLIHALEKPVEIVATDEPLPDPPANLLPSAWANESQRVERNDRVRQRLMVAAVIYLLLLAGAFVYLAITKHKVQQLDAQLAAIQPQIQATQTAQKRWATLAPAVDPHRYAEEIIFQVNKCRSSDELHITLFEIDTSGFKIEAEAPQASLMVAFADQLRRSEDLKAFQITSSPPKYIKGAGVQFSIFGK